MAPQSGMLQRGGASTNAPVMDNPALDPTKGLLQAFRQSGYEEAASRVAPADRGPAAGQTSDVEAPASKPDQVNLEDLKRWVQQGYEVHPTAADRARGGDAGQRAPLPGVPLQSYERGAFSMTLELGKDGAVLSFAGTDPKSVGDLATDASALGVGFGQFADNSEAIQMWLRMATSITGQKVTVVGHSLGGAHAQWAASFFPEYVDHVYTMDAPGIANEAVGQLDAHNAAKPDEAVDSTHFLTDSGIAFAGEQHTPGSVHWYDTGKNAKVLPTTHSSLLFPTDRNRIGGAMDSRAFDKEVLGAGLEGNRDLGGGVGLVVGLALSPLDVERWAKLQRQRDPKAGGLKSRLDALKTVGRDRAEAVGGAASSIKRDVGTAASAGWDATKRGAGNVKSWAEEQWEYWRPGKR